MIDIRVWTKPLSRHALARPNWVYYLWRYVANGVRSGRAFGSRLAFPDARQIAGEITREGITVATTDQLLSTGGQQAFARVAERMLAASRTEAVEAVIAGASTGDVDSRKDYVIHLASLTEGMSLDDPLLEVALDRKPLEIVASYLGFWPSLQPVEGGRILVTFT